MLLAAAVLVSLAGAYTSEIYMNKMRESEFQAIAGIVAAVKGAYPQVDETEIIGVLNGKADTGSTEEMLLSYGIKKDDFIVFQNEKVRNEGVAVTGTVYFVCSMMFVIILLVYSRSVQRRNRILTDYVSEINRGNYDLMPKENTEDEYSVLRNEIYKTTVTLREAAFNKARDKENLKNSISDISHQLKTPLTSIGIMLDGIITDEDMPEDVRREFLADIKKNTDHISFLVQSLLKLSQLEADSINMKKENVSAQKLFKSCIEKTEIIADIHDTTVIVEAKADVTICCDEKWTTEALTNIIKNCIEYSYKNGRVILSAENTGLYKCIRIKDNGTGIDRKDLPHIFERFYKGKNTDKNSIGIGLALSKAILDKQNALIRVSSEPRIGTEFTILVPDTPNE